MQSTNIKYLMTKKLDLFLFFHEGSTLFYKIQTPSGWSQPQVLAEHTGSAFSVSHFDSIIYVLYSTIEGNLVLAKTTDMSYWEKKQLISDKQNLSQTKIFFLPEQTEFHMVYHLPTETTGVHWLVYAAYKDGKWEKPYRIDRFLPFPGEPFFVGRITRNHIILYYRSARNVISAREMLLSPYTLGSVNPMIQTSYPCKDLSIISDSKRIHLLYTVKGMFRSQVVYQYKQASSISTPRVIWEDTSCEQCLIYKTNQTLQLMWISNGQSYICSSENNGSSFGTVEKYTSYFPKRCVKGEMIQATDTPPYLASEAFSDITNGYQPTIFQNTSASPFDQAFMANQRTAEAKTQPQSKAKKSEPMPTDEQLIQSFQNFTEKKNPNSAPIVSNAPQGNIPIYADNQSKPFFPSDNMVYSQESSHPYAALFESQKQQVEELTRVLAQRNEEIADVNAKWKEQTIKQEEEIDRLKQVISSLRAENSQLQQQVSSLQQPDPPELPPVQNESQDT